LFYVCTFIVTHGLSVGYAVVGGSWSSPSAFAVANALMLVPGLVAIGLQRFVYREPVAERLGLRFRPTKWFVVAWLFPPAVMLAALGLSLLLPAATYAGDMGGLPSEMDAFKHRVASFGVAPIIGMVALALVVGPTLNAIGGLGEEVGWRGFVYKELLPLGFWRCSLVTGVLWAAWHVPLFFEGYGDRQHPLASALGMLAFAILLAPLLHLLRQRSGSVVACSILHGTMSSSRLLSVAFVRDAGPWANGAIPFVLLYCVLAVLVIRNRGSLSRRKQQPRQR
jgi:membrane protease YdiL (CAAX protease family)